MLKYAGLCSIVVHSTSSSLCLTSKWVSPAPPMDAIPPRCWSRCPARIPRRRLLPKQCIFINIGLIIFSYIRFTRDYCKSTLYKLFQYIHFGNECSEFWEECSPSVNMSPATQLGWKVPTRAYTIPLTFLLQLYFIELYICCLLNLHILAIYCYIAIINIQCHLNFAL